MSEPKNPTKAFVDSDVILFQAASAAEKVQYTYKDKDGNVVATFDKAADGKQWLAEVETFGMDLTYGYDGSLEDLTRETSYLDLGVEVGKKRLRELVEVWKDMSKCKEWLWLISPESGATNFRNDICTLDIYKGNRKDTHKPVHLEGVREYAIKSMGFKSTPSKYHMETDDVVQGMAQAAGEDGLLMASDKDIKTAVECWVLFVGDNMKDPVYSDPTTTGWVAMDGKKIDGVGLLFLLAQATCGDTADFYKGLPKCGAKGAVKLLEKWNNKPIEDIHYAIQAVIDAFTKHYKGSVTYKHCYTGEEITKTPYGMFHEQISLAYMRRSPKDDVDKSVLKYYKGEKI